MTNTLQDSKMIEEKIKIGYNIGMDEDDLPTELELAAMLKVLMSLPKEEAEKLIGAYCGEDDSKP